MIGFEPVFIDSPCFIYLVENNLEFGDRVYRFFIEEQSIKENSLITSVISVSEFNVKPFRENDSNLLMDFRRVIDAFHISVLDINTSMANEAAKLRAKYSFLKTADALQLGSAINFNCKRFVTNDIRLKTITEIDVVLIRDLKN